MGGKQTFAAQNLRSSCSHPYEAERIRTPVLSGLSSLSFATMGGHMGQFRASAGGPVDASERSALLDSLRGWALLGILAANMMSFAGFVFMAGAQRDATVLAGLNDVSELLLEWLVIGKFYALFSLLFGIGFAIQIDRLEQRGEGAGCYLRRLAILFAIGIAHMLLLWLGDILALYALMGAVLLLFRRVPGRSLLIWAAALWLIPIGWAAAMHFGAFRPDQLLFSVGIGTVIASGADFSRGPISHYQSADIFAHLKAHPGEMLIRLGILVEQMRFPKVLGMFLIGLWAGRRAIHVDPAAFRPLLRRVAWVCLCVGLPLSLAKAVLTTWPGDSSDVAFAAEVFYCLSTPTLTLGYAAGFTMLWLGMRRRWAEVAAPAGRMALTNYLMQTVLQSALFYGWGLGLMGKLGVVLILPLSMAIFALQVAYSQWWLSRYRFGPLEWLWRSATYGALQSMRLGRTRVAPTAAP